MSDINRRRVLQSIGTTGAISISGLSGCIGFGGESGGDEGTITIGELNPLSGGASVYGTPEHQGLVVGVDDLGEFEVDGSTYTFEVDESDDQCSNSNGISIIQRYLQQENYNFIAGSICSNVNEAIASEISQANVIQFINGSWAQELTYGRDNVFRNSYTGAMTDPALIQLAKDREWESIALLGDEQHPSITASHERLQESLPAAGVDVEVIWYSRGQEDYSSQIQRARSFEPDVLEVAGYTGDVYSAIGQAREFDMSVPIIELSNSSESAIRSAVDDLSGLDGVMPLGAALSPMVAAAGHEPGQNYMDKVTERFGEDLAWHVGGAHYDMVFSLATAMQEAGTVDDVDAIRSELVNVTVEKALGEAPIGGPAQMYTPLEDGTMYDDHGQAWHPTILREWQGGELEVQETIELESVPAYPDSVTD